MTGKKMAETSPESRAEMISFVQLRLFESVGRLCSLRRTSEECNLSQPAVTQALAKLEQHVGFALLHRRASGSYLNESGAIFHRRVSNFVRSVERALVELGVPGGEAAAPIFARRLSRAKIRNLLAIVSCVSVQRAAERLGLSQASLQRAAHDLERNLQCQLFHRTSDGLMVTHAGAQFGRTLHLAMQEVEWGIAEIEAALGRFQSRISIGALPSGGSVLLSSVLEEFVSAYPQVEVRIINENAAAMMKTLRDGAVDFVIGLAQQSVPPDLAVELLARTPYAIAVRRGHELLHKSRITAEDLLKYDWVIGLNGSCRRACFEGLFAKIGRPRAQIISSTLGVTRLLLERSDRLTLMTNFELQHETSKLAALPFGPLEPVGSMGVTMRANWNRTALHDHFIDLLRRRMTQFSKPTVQPQAKAITPAAA